MATSTRTVTARAVLHALPGKSNSLDDGGRLAVGFSLRVSCPPRSRDHERDTGRDGRTAGNRRDGNGLVLDRFGLDRPDIQHLVAVCVTDLPNRERDDTENDQQYAYQ